MTAQGGSSRFTLELLGGLHVREKAFGLPSFLRHSTTRIRDPAVFHPPLFFSSISSTNYGVALARKKHGKGLCRGANVYGACG